MSEQLERLTKLNTFLLLSQLGGSAPLIDVEGNLPFGGDISISAGSKKAQYQVQPLSETSVADPAITTVTPLAAQPTADPILFYLSTELQVNPETVTVNLTSDGITYTGTQAAHQAEVRYWYISPIADALISTDVATPVMLHGFKECKTANAEIVADTDNNAGDIHILRLKWGRLL